MTERGLTEHIARHRRDVITLGPCQLAVLNPPQGTGFPQERGGRRQEGHTLKQPVDCNASLTCGPHRVLFTADVEQDALIRME